MWNGWKWKFSDYIKLYWYKWYCFNMWELIIVDCYIFFIDLMVYNWMDLILWMVNKDKVL